MRIAVINGSPRTKGSNSGYIIRELIRRVDTQDIITFKFNKPELQAGDIEKIAECRVLIFAFPLYVDGIRRTL
jgi:multimeric flavodoxin WrbA